MLEVKKILTVNLCSIYLICTAGILLLISCQAKSEVTSALTKPSAVATIEPSAVVAENPVSKIKFSSAYTKLDSKTCRPISKAENEEDEVPDLCTGYKGYKIFVSHHGTATRIYIGREIPTDRSVWDASALPSFIANDAGHGQIIEWRLANGEPFACIVRARYDKQIINPDEKGTVNELVVRNLNGYAPIHIVIDAKKNTRASTLARRRADAGFGKL